MHTSTGEKRLDERWAMHGKWCDRIQYIYMAICMGQRGAQGQTDRQEREEIDKQLDIDR